MRHKSEGPRAWDDREINLLRVMSEEGKNNLEISEILGRTTSAVAFKKSKMRIQKIKREKNDVDGSVVPELSIRDHCKNMARAARKVARSNGKRITMSMFVIENL
jgi:formate-dependent nitrite reductase cytochrome c552 subunit